MWNRGGTARSEIQQINERLVVMREEAIADFPLDEAGVVALQEHIAEHVLCIHDIEEAAVTELRAAMA